MHVIIFDREWVVVQIGYDERRAIRFTPDSDYVRINADDDQPVIFDKERPTPSFDSKLKKLNIETNSFVMEFPGSDTSLIIEPKAIDQGAYLQIGKLVVQDLELGRTEYPVRNVRVRDYNWFGTEEVESDEAPSFDFDGRWVLDSPVDSAVAIIEIAVIMDRYHAAEPNADAVLLSFSTQHRNFAGRITGNRIRLASFDNAYPALIDATIQEDGTLKGDLWVGDRLHETFTATKQ